MRQKAWVFEAVGEVLLALLVGASAGFLMWAVFSCFSRAFQ